MAVTPLKTKKESGPAWWDKPLAAIMIIVFVAVLVLFVLQYTGPASAIP